MEEFELEAGEEIITSVRVHPYVLAMRLLPFVLMTFVPVILSGLLATFVPSFHSSVTRFFSGFWLLCVWVGAFTTFTQYYLTVWVITSMRIVDIKQRGFFSREVSSFMLTRVQDVTTDTNGVLGTVFHFGRLSVETAGKDEDFAMNGIAAPEQVRDIIMRQVSMMHQPNPSDSGV